MIVRFRFGKLVVLLLIVLATLGVALEFGMRLTNDWITIWTGMTPLIGAITLIVLGAAAYYAGNQVSITRENARVDLTNSVLNSDWAQRGTDAANDFVYAHGNLGEARNVHNALWDEQEQTRERNVVVTELNHKIGGAYTYLSRLYLRGVLDEQLLIESSAWSVVYGVYIIEKQLRAFIHAGVFDDDILDLARICFARFTKRPEVLVFHPYLRDWKI